jgi:hypothetical protein
MILTLIIFIFVIVFFIFFYLNKRINELQTTKEETTEIATAPLPYWVYYGQPSYWPPYWYFNGPVNKPWGPSGKRAYRPGHGPGYSGVAVGGGGSGGHGGGGH